MLIRSDRRRGVEHRGKQLRQVMEIGASRLARPALMIAAVLAAPLAAQTRDNGAEPQYPGHLEPLAGKCGGRPGPACHAAGRVAAGRDLPVFAPAPEPVPTETLAEDLDLAYRTSPGLAAQRYQLKANDEDYAQAVAELRPTSQLQVTLDYSRTVEGRLSQMASFYPGDLAISKTLSATATVNQPLYTGGRAAADREAALAEVRASRQQLRGSEGNLMLQVITAYANVRLDTETLRLRIANLKQLSETLDEVIARKESGDLTRTDIGLAMTQLELARSLCDSTEQQLEQDRAVFAAYVGREAGALAPPPPLPDLPESRDAAFAVAEDLSPDLAQAIATETESRARIGAAQAQGRPTVGLTGNASLTGPAVPFYLHNDDQVFEGRVTLTIPITNGGRVGSLAAQAEDRNGADRLGIESARRQMIANITSAWSAVATARRNIATDEREVTAAKIYDEGTFEEYRSGLRSTFDVLYAHGTLRDAEIALTAARHDLYVAEATLLRNMGLLEARSLLTGTKLYDPDPDFRHAAGRGALPWDGAVRTLDRINRPHPRQPALSILPPAAAAPAQAPGQQVPASPAP